MRKNTASTSGCTAKRNPAVPYARCFEPAGSSASAASNVADWSGESRMFGGKPAKLRGEEKLGRTDARCEKILSPVFLAPICRTCPPLARAASTREA